jgi:HSP20 family protein
MSYELDRFFPDRDGFFGPLEQHFDNFFNSFFGTPSFDGLKNSVDYPKMDVTIEKDSFVVRAAVPGVKAENLKVEVIDNILKLSGGMAEEYKSDKNNDKHYVRELRKSYFERKVKLPKDLVGDPEADLKDGLLTLRWKLPKIEQKPASKVIEVKVIK